MVFSISTHLQRECSKLMFVFDTVPMDSNFKHFFSRWDKSSIHWNLATFTLLFAWKFRVYYSRKKVKWQKRNQIFIIVVAGCPMLLLYTFKVLIFQELWHSEYVMVPSAFNRLENLSFFKHFKKKWHISTQYRTPCRRVRIT